MVGQQKFLLCTFPCLESAQSLPYACEARRAWKWKGELCVMLAARYRHLRNASFNFQICPVHCPTLSLNLRWSKDNSFDTIWWAIVEVPPKHRIWALFFSDYPEMNGLLDPEILRCHWLCHSTWRFGDFSVDSFILLTVKLGNWVPIVFVDVCSICLVEKIADLE